MHKNIFVWKNIFPRKTIYFYNKSFVNYLNKTLNKSRSVIKKESYYPGIKTHNYTKAVLNNKIEECYLNYYLNNKKSSLNIWLKHSTLHNLTETTLVLKKELILLRSHKIRQYHFFINEFIKSLNKTNNTLIQENLFDLISFSTLKNNFRRDYDLNKLNLFYSKYLSNNIIISNIPYQTLTSNKNYYLTSFLLKLFFNYLLFKPSLNTKEFLLNIILYNNILQKDWSLKNIYSNTKNLTISNVFQTRIKKAYFTFFSNTIIPGRVFKKIILNHKNYQSNPKILIWKRNNTLTTKKQKHLFTTNHKTFFLLPHNRAQYYNQILLIKKNKNRFNNFSQVLYIISRLEEKIDMISKNETKKDFLNSLVQLHNFLTYNVADKKDKNIINGLILSNTNEIFKMKTIEWRALFLTALNQWLDKKTMSSNAQKLHQFYEKIESGINAISISTKKLFPLKKSFNTKNIFFPYTSIKNKNLFTQILNKRKEKTTLLMHEREYFNYQKLTFNDNYLNHIQIKEILNVITQKNVKIFYINALSLTKYAFNLERVVEKKEKRSPRLFLQTIDRDLINKYKYIGIYIKDLIRVCFIGMFLKNARFLAKYIAFQIGERPHNRKETSFIRFIIKVAKTFAAEREEILGFRIRFKGRVNRWRRTKAIIGSRGVIPFHTVDSRIECGSAQAINRKGALGIRIWIRYKPSFSLLIKNSILKYFAYSKQLETRKTFLRKIYFNKKH